MVTIFWEFEHKICYSSAFTIDIYSRSLHQTGSFRDRTIKLCHLNFTTINPGCNGRPNEVWIMDNAQLRTDQKYRKAVSK